MKQSTREHSSSFKARAALEALKGEETVAEPAAWPKAHPSRVPAWKKSRVPAAD
jgi:hypothetical protein